MEMTTLHAISDNSADGECTEWPTLKVERALDVMKKSTRRLDELLQQMCESSSISTASSSSSPSRSSSPLSSSIASSVCSANADELRACLPVEAPLLPPEQRYTPDEYFKAVRTAFSPAPCKPLRVTEPSLRKLYAVAHSSANVDDGNGNDASRIWKSFLQDTGVLFTTGSAISVNVANEKALHNQLVQSVHDVDHLVPVEIATEMAHRVMKMLQDLELKEAALASTRALFPTTTGDDFDSNNATVIQWKQGSRVCRVTVRECERHRQWGLELQFELEAILRAKVDGPNIAEALLGPRLQATTQAFVFIAKKDYYHDDGSKGRAQLHSTSSKETSTSHHWIESSELWLRLIDIVSESANDHKPVHALGTPPPWVDMTTETTPAVPELVDLFQHGQHEPWPTLGTSTYTQSSSSSHVADGFHRLDLDSPLPRTRVMQAACGRFHSLLLTDQGHVFSYGHAMDGALGHGEPRGAHDLFLFTPRLVEYFLDHDLVVVSVACGGDAVSGLHSVCVTRDQGHVYSWGVASALGAGALPHSRSEPQRISIQDDQQQPVTVVSVSAGTCFCVALADTGTAYAWGKWSDGRLGLGAIPSQSQPQAQSQAQSQTHAQTAPQSRRRGGSRRRHLPRFQWRAAPIAMPPQPQPQPPSTSPSTSSSSSSSTSTPQASNPRWRVVRCGDAHCLALTEDGRLFTWGRGAQGQLGHGAVRDALVPTAVAPTAGSPRTWQDISAGSDWSLALDADGVVWTWGASGRAVLGQPLGHRPPISSSADANTDDQLNVDAGMATTFDVVLARHRQLEQQQRRSTSRAKGKGKSKSKSSSSSSSDVLPVVPVFAWLAPQRVASLADAGVVVRSLSAGHRHAACVSSEGDLYLWGDGSGDDRPLSAVPTLVSPPSTVGGRVAVRVFCGAAHTLVLAAQTSFLARDLQHLHHSAQALATSATMVATAVDLVLLAGGHTLFAHKWIVAQRSAVLAAMIRQQEQERWPPDQHHGATRRGQPTELLIPQLQGEVARVVLAFCYTDTLLTPPHAFLVRDVLRAAQRFQMPALVRLCRAQLTATARALAMSSSCSLPDRGHGAAAAKEEGSESYEWRYGGGGGGGDGSLVEDLMRTPHERAAATATATAWTKTEWSDLILRTESHHEFHVHRCILLARSEYFRALLTFHERNPREPDDPTSAPAIDTVTATDTATVDHHLVVEVDDSVEVMARVLHFLYTDELLARQDPTPTTRNAKLLEDLIAADKYGLLRLHRLTERYVEVTSSTAMDTFLVADAVQATELRERALRICHQRQRTAWPHEMRAPPLVAMLYEREQQRGRQHAMLTHWQRKVAAQEQAQRDARDQHWRDTMCVTATTAFPWPPLLVALVAALLFLAVMHQREVDWPIVPAVNVVAIASLLVAAILGKL